MSVGFGNGKTLAEPIFDLDALPMSDPIDDKELKLSIFNDTKAKKKKTKKEKEWGLQMTCTQEWFIRCAWINKFIFLKSLCLATRGFRVLKTILQCSEIIFCKDVLESLSQDSTIYFYDAIPIDNNRSLSDQELNTAMKNSFCWFLSLDPSHQTQIILRLLRLGGGGLVFNIYKLVEQIYKERQGKSTIFSLWSKHGLVNNKGKSIELEKGKVLGHVVEIKSSESNNESANDFFHNKIKELERREEELYKYRKLKGLLVDDSNLLKKSEIKESVDYLQILPIWLNRKIMSYIDDKSLSGFKRVGKYWGKMIDESINEKSGRKAINAKINKIIGIKADKNEKKNEEENRNKEVELITELGVKNLINKKKESENFSYSSLNLYDSIFSKKCEIKVVDSIYYPERCGTFDKKLELLGCSAPQNMIHFYSVRTGARFNYLVFGLQSTVTCLKLHENQNHIFLGCQDGSVMAKDMRTNSTVASFSGHTKPVFAIFTTKTNILTASTDNTVKYFQLWSRACLLCIDFKSEFNISSVLLITKKPTRTAIGTKEGVLILAEVPSRKFLVKLKLYEEKITQLALDGDFLITGSENGKIRVWNVNTLHMNIPTLKPYYNICIGSSVSCLKYYNNLILCGCENGTVKIISFLSGKIFKTIKLSSQIPIIGMDLTEDKLFMKLIIWHKKGIEIRSFSLQTLSIKKDPMKKHDAKSKQKAPKETRGNKPSEMVLSGYARKNHGLIEARPNAYKRMTSGMKMALSKRCCTLLSLRTLQRKPREFNTNVFTETFNANCFHSNNDFLNETKFSYA